MAGLRLWHLMVVVAASAVLFALARYDCPCTPITPVLAGAYVCAGFGALAARRTGWRVRMGLLLGLLLGPLGVLLACSKPPPPEAPGDGSGLGTPR